MQASVRNGTVVLLAVIMYLLISGYMYQAGIQMVAQADQQMEIPTEPVEQEELTLEDLQNGR